MKLGMHCGSRVIGLSFTIFKQHFKVKNTYQLQYGMHYDSSVIK